MKLSSLTIKDINGLHAELDLSSLGPGLCCMIGPNGAGKSTLAELLLYVLYQGFETHSGHPKAFITGTDPMAQVEFEHSGHSYRARIVPSDIRRTETYLWRDGDSAAMNEGGKVSDYAPIIKKLFGSRRLVTSALYSCWGGAGNLLTLSRADRRELFAEALDIDGHQTISDAAKASAEEIDTTCLTVQITSAENLLVRYGPYDESIQQRVAQLSENVDAADHDKLDAQMIASELRRDVTDLREKQSKIGSLETSRSFHEQRVAELNHDLECRYPEMIGRAATQRDDAVSEAEAEASRIGHYQEAEADRDDMRSYIDQLKERHAECEQRVFALMPAVEIAERIETASKKAREVATKLTEANHDELLRKVEHLQSMRTEYRGTMEAKRLLDDEIAELQEMVQNNKHEPRRADELQRTIEAREVPCGGSGEYASCPLLRSLKVDATDEDLLHEYLKAIESTRELRVAEEELREIRAENDELVKRLTELGMSGKQYSGAEEALDAYNTAAKIADDLQSEYHELLDAHKYAGWETAEEDTVIELEAQQQYYQAIRDAENQWAQLSIEAGKLSGAMQAKDRISSAEQRYVAETARIESLRSETEQDLRQAEAELRSVDDQLAKLRHELVDLDKTVEHLAAIEAKVSDLDRTLTEKMQECARAQEQLKIEQAREVERQKARNSIAQLSKRLAEQEEHVREWQLLQRAFGRTGIQALELDAASAGLNSVINELLSDWPEFAVNLVTQQPLANGKGYKEVFDLEIIRNGKVIAGDNPSAGQQAVLCEAISAGFSSWIRERYGFRAETLIRDESTATLREDTAELYMKLLRRVLEMTRAHQILYVAHQHEVIAAADTVLLVENGKVRQV